MVISRRWSMVQCIVVALLVFAMFGGALAKVVSGHDRSLLLPPTAYYATALLEVVLGVLLWRGASARTLGLYGLLGLCCLGATSGYLWPDRPCGCLGSAMVLSQAVHSAWSAAVASLCLIALGHVDPDVAKSSRS